MTADHEPVETPKHALSAMTTAELAKYRRDLEKAIADSAPVQLALAQQLDAVKAEQEDRKRIADGS